MTEVLFATKAEVEALRDQAAVSAASAATEATNAATSAGNAENAALRAVTMIAGYLLRVLSAMRASATSASAASASATAADGHAHRAEGAARIGVESAQRARADRIYIDGVVGSLPTAEQSVLAVQVFS